MAANPYDPVTTTDSTQLTDDDWGLSLPRYKPYGRTSRFKSACNYIRQHHRAVMIGVTAFGVIILIVVIIAVAASQSSERHPTGREGRWESNKQGLEFYPVPEDRSIVIYFTPDDFRNRQPPAIKKSLDTVFSNYSSTKQLNESIFTDCKYGSSPGNMTCKISNTLFGDECTPQMNYGYLGSQPCVFIQLNLPDGVTIKPIDKASPLWEQAQEIMKDKTNPSYVPFTCRGTEPVDQEILDSVNGYGIQGKRIVYLPEQGLLSYIYRERDAKLPFLKPAVMVQITHLVSRRMVHITCTAWGQLYDGQGQQIKHKLLTTQFALFSNHD